MPRRSALVTLIAMTVFAVAVRAAAGPTFNVIFHANLDQHAAYNDIWGYTAPNGNEYALLGCTTGLAVINVSDPDAPYETGFISGATSTWRDIKTYGSYAYVTNETSGGIAIVNLSNPESPVLAASYTGGGLSRAHNLYIDTATGRLYTAGSNLGSGGTRILNLAIPTAPVEVGSWETVYFHDVVVQNNRLFGSAINVGRLYVLDVTNPASIPAPLGTASGYPSAFTHNAWPTPDGLYVMTTDELSTGACRMWDMSTLPTLQQTDFYKPNATTIPHNTHIDGDFAYISHYTLGVKIVDVSDPFNLVEVGAYDTWPSDDGSTYDGCWGAFPFFQTNPDLLVASDISTGLYVLEFRGPLGTLAGEVRRSGSPGVTVSGATLEILETGTSTRSDATGHYSLEDSAGDVHLQVSAFGYETTVVPATIVSSVVTPLDVDLVLVPSGSLSGIVTDAASSLPVWNAEVKIESTPLVETTDLTGAYVHDAIPVGTYGVRVEAFGYNPMTTQIVVTAAGALTIDFPLNPAVIADTFQEPYPGWSVTGSVTSGAWERADPEPTFYGGVPIQPGDDHSPPPGTFCWVTGPLAGTQIGSFDVDGGETILTSPVFSLAGTTDPRVSYWRWYATGEGGNPSVDVFTVRVSPNGGTSWVVLESTDRSSGGWILVDVPLGSLIPPTETVRFQFTARDTGAGSITEALIDDFMIYDGPDILSTSAPVATAGTPGLELGRSFPNPFRPGDVVATDFRLPVAGPVRADVFDVTGRRVVVLEDRRMDAGRHRLVWDGRGPDGEPEAAGVYFLRLQADGQERSRKILRLR